MYWPVVRKACKTLTPPSRCLTIPKARERALHMAVKTDSAALTALLDRTRTESGRTLLQLVDESPVLLVFLRHFGCAFCRQAIDDVSKVRPDLTRLGVQAAFVHLGSPERAKPYFDYYNLSDWSASATPTARSTATPSSHWHALAFGRSSGQQSGPGGCEAQSLNTASASSKKTSSRCPAFSF